MKFLGLGLIAVNIVGLDVFFYQHLNKKATESLVKSDSCPLGCNEIMDKKVKSLLVPTLVVVSPTPTVKIIKKDLPKKTKSTQYIPIFGSGSTMENKWVDLPGTEFYISTEDYPGLIGAYFEANMKLVNGNGLAYLRLFDITAGIEVWGSEISTNNQNFSSVSSGKMTIRTGTHLYRVQAKSLTADTTIFNSGRIKIILEN